MGDILFRKAIVDIFGKYHSYSSPFPRCEQISSVLLPGRSWKQASLKLMSEWILNAILLLKSFPNCDKVTAR